MRVSFSSSTERTLPPVMGATGDDRVCRGLDAWGQRGYPARIRTLNNGTKIRCVTITPRGTRPVDRKGVHRRQRAGCKGRLRIFWPWVPVAEKPSRGAPLRAARQPAACRRVQRLPQVCRVGGQRLLF